MTFRTSKRHRVQESSKSQKNVLKLASKLQHFLNTGKASKQDLKAIDSQISQITADQGDKILKLLDQLKEGVAKSKGRDLIQQVCDDWAKWLSSMDSKKSRGYSGVRPEKSDSRNALVEATIEADSEVFRMLSAFNASLALWVRQASHEVPDFKEISSCAHEIIDAHATRQKILAKISG
ncbi:MAG: hypothetical protein ACRDF4_06985 [Rhabdochlamydiaceae bacterium]